MAYPYTAIATLKYRPPPTSGPSISFDKGQRITVLAAADDDGDWLEGENEQGVKGVFPATFVQRVDEEEPVKQQDGGAAVETEAATLAQKEDELVPIEASQEKGDESTAPPAPAAVESAASTVADPAPTSAEPPTSPPAPARQPSLPSVDAPEPASTTPKSAPPPPAKKPNALAARIAAFNTAGSAPTPAPIPRPKPASKWSRPSPPVAAPAAAEGPSSSLPAAPPALVQSESSDSSAGKPKEFSAEDAKESIGKGGGSLRDRIAALQGLKMDQPAPPGRAPKPWKKKVVEEEAAPEEGATTIKEEQADAEKNLEEAVVKDHKPNIDETTHEGDVPGFEPAEATTEELREQVQDYKPASAKEDDSIGATAPVAASVDEPTPVDLPPSHGAPSESVEPTAVPALESSSAGPKAVELEPTEGEAAPVAEAEEDSEEAKRSAIAARMAGLGGQRMGLPMPALPKRAAGPRRNKSAAKSPAAEEPAIVPVAAVPAQVEQESIGEVDKQVEQVATTEEPVQESGTKEIEAEAVQPVEPATEKGEDVLASMGGASKLLGNDEDDEEEEPADIDDFDTPAPPAPPRPAGPPPPAAAGFEEKPTDLSDPELEEGETQVEEDEFAQRDEPQEEERTVGEEAVEALPTPASAELTVDDVKDEEPESLSAPPPLPASRPPMPPPFVRAPTDQPSADEGDQEKAAIDNPEPVTRSPPPPTRPIVPPPISTGAETITDEPRPTAKAPDALSPPLPDLASRPPLPPMLASFAVPSGDEREHPPIPRHPAPLDKEKVTTAAEDQIMNEMEVVTPTQEAADESTAGIEVDAPSVAHIAEGRQAEPQGGVAQSSLPQPGKTEGELSPPQQLSSGSQSPAEEKGEDEGEDEEEEEEEEEEDPEVARRRALAARMAKLGGMNMRMGPMIPPIGGIGAMGGPKKTVKKKKAVKAEEEKPQEPEEQAVESAFGTPSPTPDYHHHHARHVGSFPAGGFALPGIAPLRPPPQPRPEAEPEAEAETEEQPTDASIEAEAEPDVQQKDEPAPPPIPANRPPSMPPPSRSIPPPFDGTVGVVDDAELAALDRALSEEPEDLVDEPEKEEDELPAPPPPPRPAGGHQSSVPTSPPLPPSALPSSPPTRTVPTPSSQDSTSSLARQTTRSSRRSSTFLSSTAEKMGFSASPRQSLDLAFDAERVQAGGAPGAYAARDLDLDAMSGNAWWRVKGGLPRSLQGRRDVLCEVVSEASSTRRGKTRSENEIEVIYPDFSKTLISIAFDVEDTTETTTALSQAHFPPPAKPSLEVLLRWSASLGAQIFGAAYAKAGDKSARGLTDEQLVDFCFGRASEPLGPIGSTYGAKVFEVTVEGKKGAAVAEDDEPRAGDIVVFRDVKLKQTLGSKTVGSHVAIVGGWDAKKHKLRVLEVDAKNGGVDENSYKLDEVKQGKVEVFRVAPRDYV
ncbi:hypothetical protein JCM5296_000640 [Sporobolomyces johnsonii]